MMQKIIFVLVALLGHMSFAQSSGTIYGRITDIDAEGEPLLFATVSVKDMGISEQTNFHGNFEITGVPSGDYILQVNYLGYEPKEIPIRVRSGQVALIEEGLKTISMETEALVLTESTESLPKVADRAEKQ